MSLACQSGTVARHTQIAGISVGTGMGTGTGRQAWVSRGHDITNLNLPCVVYGPLFPIGPRALRNLHLTNMEPRPLVETTIVPHGPPGLIFLWGVRGVPIENRRWDFRVFLTKSHRGF